MTVMQSFAVALRSRSSPTAIVLMVLASATLLTQAHDVSHDVVAVLTLQHKIGHRLVRSLESDGEGPPGHARCVGERKEARRVEVRRGTRSKSVALSALGMDNDAPCLRVSRFLCSDANRS